MAPIRRQNATKSGEQAARVVRFWEGVLIKEGDKLLGQGLDKIRVSSKKPRETAKPEEGNLIQGGREKKEKKKKKKLDGMEVSKLKESWFEEQTKKKKREGGRERKKGVIWCDVPVEGPRHGNGDLQSIAEVTRTAFPQMTVRQDRTLRRDSRV